jgi:hypothetical protein
MRAACMRACMGEKVRERLCASSFVCLLLLLLLSLSHDYRTLFLLRMPAWVLCRKSCERERARAARARERVCVRMCVIHIYMCACVYTHT